MSATGPERVLLLGGTSEIGLAIVRRLAQARSIQPYLLGRNDQALREAAVALGREGAVNAEHGLLDADDLTSHDQVMAEVFDRAGGFDLVIVAVGVLGAQAALDADTNEAAEVMRVNFVGAGSLLLAAMRCLRKQGSGTVVVLSSVAAERPRAGNAIYGAAKAGFDSLAQGLADASAADGAPRVLVVRPGFVKTRMTEGLDPAPFATTADAVASATVRALAGNAHTVWIPGRLRFVFSVLRHLPRPLYRRLPL